MVTSNMSSVRGAAFVVAAVALASGALAQSGAVTATHAEGRTWFSTGVQAYLNASAFTVFVSGEEWRGGVRTPLEVTASFQRTTNAADPRSWLEVAVRKGGAQSHRIVGDGERMWLYSRPTHEYSSYQYQNLENPKDGYLGRMLTAGARWSPKEADFAVRLLKDLFSGGDLMSRWTPWLSGVSQVTVAADRLLAEVSYSGPVSWITYRYERETEDSAWLLKQVSFREERMIGGQSHGTSWTATLLPDVVAETATFQFQPPAGARVRAIG